MVAVFWIQFPNTFGTWENAKQILLLAAPLLVLAVGLTLVLIVGEFDLSFAGIIALSALAIAETAKDGGHGVLTLITVALAVGFVAGLLAGALVSAERASSFIVTLALNTVWVGLALGISGGKYISIESDGFNNISLSSAGLPVPVWIAFAVSLVAIALIRLTVFGRQLRAVGSNREAARLAGVRVNVTRIKAFGFLGLCAGLSAVLLTASAGSYTPDVGGGLFIPPFVAAFFGISVMGMGRFNVFGTVVGALFIQTLQTGLTFNNVSAWVSNVVIGVVLLVILFVAGQLRQV